MTKKKNSEIKDNEPSASKNGNWVSFDGCDWATLLAAQPQFASRCDWTKLDGVDWVALLAAQPQLAKHCDWSQLTAANWARLLSVRPEFEKEFEAADNLVDERPTVSRRGGRRPRLMSAADFFADED